MQKQRTYLFFLLGLLVVVGCQRTDRFFPKEVENANIRIVRFDSALLSLPTDSVGLRAGIERLWEEDSYTLHLFAENIMGIDIQNTMSIDIHNTTNIDVENSMGFDAAKMDVLCGELKMFLEDTVYGFAETNEKVREVFADVKEMQTELNKAFGRVHYLYPEWQMPTVYLTVTGFQGNSMWLEDGFLIGVDMYLGSDYPYYNRVVHEYQKKHMRKECIAGDVVLMYLYENLSNPSNNRRLLDNILFTGRIMYLMQELMPDKKPAYIIGYTEEQWKWCEQHEKGIWGVICDKQDLFSTSPLTINGYTSDGPFTSEVSQDSPAQLGTWVGWRIIDSYMNQHPEITLQELIEMEDAQQILQESKYKP